MFHFRFNAAETVAMLLHEGADPCSKQDVISGCAPLYLAASCGSTKVVKCLLNDKRIDMNLTNPQGLTPLQIACSRGHDEVCAILLQHGACVDSRTEEGITALHYAASNADPKMVSLILNWGEISDQFLKHSGLRSSNTSAGNFRATNVAFRVAIVCHAHYFVRAQQIFILQNWRNNVLLSATCQFVSRGGGKMGKCNVLRSLLWNSKT